MHIQIDRNSPTPLYIQVREAIRTLILSGSLPDGFRLPPERRMATALGVNRATIYNAYADLKADGLLEAHVGRGTIVQTPLFPGHRDPDSPPIPWRELTRQGFTDGRDPLLRDLLALTEQSNAISLSVGLPAPELVPTRVFSELAQKVLSIHGSQALLHTPSEGITPLREALCDHMIPRGIHCEPGQILVTAGSQQGLYLLAEVFLDPGDSVVVEEPSYFAALQVFREAGARLLPVPADRDGIRTDLLEGLLERHRPKFLYILPTFQNPSGATLSRERRIRLLELARRFHVPIVEDDLYSDLRYEGDALPSLLSLDRGRQVIHLSSFSKVLCPGLRIGWIAAPRPVVRLLALARQGLDLHANTFSQWILATFLREGLFEPHLQACRTLYRVRRDTLEQAMKEHAPRDVHWETPRGGFYHWCRLPEGIAPARLMAEAAREGVSYLPGEPCFVHEADRPHIRLNFSSPSPERIQEGVRRLMQAIRTCQEASSHPVREPGTTHPIV